MDSSPKSSPTETLSANLRMVLRGLLGSMGAWGMEAALALVLYRRVSLTLGRIERMLVRFRVGRLWRMKPRVAGSGRAVSRKPGFRLPRRFGWLVVLGKHHAAGFGSQLQHVLNTPEMAALLAASPQAVRMVRPLCRALALEVPGVSGARRGVAGGGSGRRPRTRSTRPKPEPYRIPLPRGVLTAARRQKQVNAAIQARDQLVLKMAKTRPR